MSDQMRAIRVEETGGPDCLRCQMVPVPRPQEGQVLIRHDVIGMNFRDIYDRTGAYPTPRPFTPGIEAAGVVEAVGSGVEQPRPGDRVAYVMEPGAYAEMAVVPAWKAVPLPAGIDASLAVAASLHGLTAHFLTHSTYRVMPGDAILVLAAGGGVGSLVVQMAKRLGALVIGTASNEEKRERARVCGADHVIAGQSASLSQDVMRLTKGAGVSAVYDSVGNTTFLESLRCLKRRGTLVLYGQSSGPAPPLDPQELRRLGSLFLTRPSLTDYIATREELLARSVAVFGMLAAGELDLKIARRFPLEEAPAAHRYLESRAAIGKVILLP